MKVPHAMYVEVGKWYKSNRFGNVKIQKLWDPGFLGIDTKGIQHGIVLEELSYIRKKLIFKKPKRKRLF